MLAIYSGDQIIVHLSTDEFLGGCLNDRLHARFCDIEILMTRIKARRRAIPAGDTIDLIFKCYMFLCTISS